MKTKGIHLCRIQGNGPITQQAYPRFWGELVTGVALTLQEQGGVFGKPHTRLESRIEASYRDCDV